MTQEQLDFEYFRDQQLHFIDFTTGAITAKGGRWGNTLYQDIGSLNPDGYERLWCNRRLRMKHRLIYFLYHGELPDKGEELDHYNSIRNSNGISNLRILTKSQNNTACANRKIGRFTKAHIHAVCCMLQNTNKSDEDIANDLDVSRPTVRDIKTRRSRKTIGSQYSWEHRGY